MVLTVHPLTPDLSPAFGELFNAREPVTRCLSLYWRTGAQYRLEQG
ncbi:MAG: hypothetical protein ABI670_07690 [Chloroflexota bacterium]